MKKRVLIFLIIGLVLYYLDLSFNSDQDKDVYISDQEIISLITAWESQVGRTPNDNEIARIINNLVEEEILYREALNLGLEKDDRIIKRRLAQKISFLKQESIKEAFTKEDVIKYFNENKEKYFIDSVFTFTHYFFSSENKPEERSFKAYADLQNNVSIDSDPFLLGKNFVQVTINDIKRDFGEEFALSFNSPQLNSWLKPIKSVFGYHIIFITDHKDGYYPDVSEIYKTIEIDLLQDKKSKSLNEYLNKIKTEYKIFINPDLKI